MIFPGRRKDDYRTLSQTGSRVYLRPGRLSDWRAWSRLREQSRAFLTPWEPTWPDDALTRRAFRRRLKQSAQEWEQGLTYSFLIFRIEDDALLGGITLSNVRRGVAQTSSLGYWIGETYARKGYMAEALRIVIDYSFNHLGLHRLEAACLPSNVASQGLLIKCGFSQQGYARQYLRINGKWQDHLLFDTLKSDHDPVRSRRR